ADGRGPVRWPRASPPRRSRRGPSRTVARGAAGALPSRPQPRDGVGGRRVDDPNDFVERVDRHADHLGLSPHELLALGEVDAVGLVATDVALDPLDRRPQLGEGLAGPDCGLAELARAGGADLRKVAFDDVSAKHHVLLGNASRVRLGWTPRRRDSEHHGVTHDVGSPGGDVLQRALQARAANDWTAAWQILCAADATAPLGAGELELLAECARFAGHADAIADPLERAHRLHAAAGDDE